MTVTEKQVGVDDDVGVEQRVAERPQSGAAVEYDHAIAAAQLEARRVAAIARGSGARASDAAAHAPELHTKAHLTSAVGSFAIERREAGRFVHARAFAIVRAA